MNAHPFTRVAKLVVIGAWMLAGAAAGVESNALQRPASLSTHARDAVLLAVTRVDKRLIAAGERGIVLFSDDDGASWKQAQVPVSVSLTDIHFPTSRKGWAVGHSGIVLHSADAGATWVRQLDGTQAAALMLSAAQQAATENNHDNAAQARLRDAQRRAAEGPDKPFFAVHFFDEQRGFIAGAYGLFFSTEDGGRSWLPCDTRLANPEARHLYSISALGGSVYIAGEQGALFRSADGGRTFSAIKTPYAGSYFGVTLLAHGKLMIYGLKGHAYRSDDAGATWRKIDTGTQAGLTAALPLAGGSFVMVTQAGEVLRGSNDGQAVQPMPVPRRFPYSGITQAADASLILSGVRGIIRLAAGQPK
ncbi:MAG: hypothetical protein V7642_4673 [Burkholderiales bacterium]